MDLLECLAHHGQEKRVHVCSLTGQHFDCSGTYQSDESTCHCVKRKFGRNTLYWLDFAAYKEWDRDRVARRKQAIIDARKPPLMPKRDEERCGLRRLPCGGYERTRPPRIPTKWVCVEKGHHGYIKEVPLW